MARKPYGTGDGGTARHVNPERGSFGSTPRVGQAAKPYTSGSNAHGIHQHRTRGPEPGARGVSRSDGPDAAGTGHAKDLKGGPRGPR